MKLLLKLKHWQLFLITWGLPMLLNIFAFSSPELMFRLFPVIMVFFTVGTFGWIWTIATELNKKLPMSMRLNPLKIKLLFIFPLVYLVGLSFYMPLLVDGMGTGVSNFTGSYGLLIVILHILSMLCIFIGIGFAAKIMKSVELGKVAKVEDYVGEFFLMCFSIIGCWVLQPRLNKLAEQ